jgi:hypothetical protein
MIADYAWADNCLSFKECRLIRKYCRDKIKTSLVEGGVVDENRKSKNCFISRDGCPPEIRASIKKALSFYFHICKEVFKFPIQEVEPIQYAEYGVGNFYNPHMDPGFDIDRDISASIVLSPRNKYKGGNLKFINLKNSLPEEKLGRIIVFPSLLMHAVEPVEKGNRASLVLWGRRKMDSPPEYAKEGEGHQDSGQSPKED